MRSPADLCRDRKHGKRAVISASRRTDIPAFYADWFIERIREGYCVVPNPRNPQQATAPISLTPEDVALIVFWTRDPLPLVKYLPELDARGYCYYFQYTLIGYPCLIDPCCPDLEHALAAFCRLSDTIGKEKVIWRYDPIVFSTITPLAWHKEQIAKIAAKLESKTEQMVISFIDAYRKTRIRLEQETGSSFRLEDRAFEPEQYLGLAQWIGATMKEHGLRVVTCAEKLDLSAYGIEHGKCIDDSLIRRILSRQGTQAPDILISRRKDPGQRPLCGCVESRDIGTNNTCRFGCKYCYAAATPT